MTVGELTELLCDIPTGYHIITEILPDARPGDMEVTRIDGLEQCVLRINPPYNVSIGTATYRHDST